MKILKLYGIGFLLVAFLSSFVFLPSFFLPGPEVDVPVYSKSTAREIAKNLKDRGILHFTLPFRALSKWTHADRKLKAGLYRLNPRMSLWEVLNVLSEGKSELLALKVPEGFTADQIAQELEKMKVMPVTEFMKTVQDPDTLKKLGIPGPTAEGYLFPETYRVPIGAGSRDLVELMVRQFLDSAGDDFEDRCRQ